MAESTGYLREEAASIIFDVFGGSTSELFIQAIDGKPGKEIVLLLKELLTDYLGFEKAHEIVDLLSQRYGLK